MLTLLVVSAMVLHMEPPETRAIPRLVVERGRVVVARSEAELRSLCRVDRRIDACTTFNEFELVATCRSDGETVAISARFRPLIILLDRNAERHELLHIADVREATVHLVNRMESKRFVTRRDCEAAAASASSEFARQLSNFARESNEKRHPHLRNQRAAMSEKRPAKPSNR